MSFIYRLTEAGQYQLFDGEEPVGGAYDEIAIAFSKSDGFRIKHGDPQRVQQFAQSCRQQYSDEDKGDNFIFQKMADDITVITGRFPIDELNKCLDISDYTGRMYTKILAGEMAMEEPNQGAKEVLSSADLAQKEIAKSTRFNFQRQRG